MESPPEKPPDESTVTPKPERIQVSEPLDAQTSSHTFEAITQPPGNALVIPAIRLDHAKPLDPSTYPNPPREGTSQLPCTIPNLEYLISKHEIRVSYDVIKKKLSTTIPGLSGTADNCDNVALAHVMSLAALNGMPLGQVPSFLAAIGDRNLVNPVVTWVTSKPWDGTDRVQALCDTLVERKGFPKPLKDELIRKWLLSAVAAAFKPSGFRNRGVLTLQGPQSIGKTAWVNALVPDPPRIRSR